MSKTSQALKNLRALAIVMVISFHSVLAYLASQPAAPQPFDSPPYHWVATPILDAERWLPFDLYAGFQYLTLMPVMFFLSGVFVWPSLKRKGSWRFLYDRLWRIGVAFVVGVYLLMPFAYYPAYRVTAIDPSWTAYWKHLVALPFWPSGPLWFLWELLVLDVAAAALFRLAPRGGEMLGQLSASAGEAPGCYFLGLVVVSALAYLPLAFAFGYANWVEFGPLALQPDRPLLYLVFFFAGVGVGAHGYDRGLLRVGAALQRQWFIWVTATATTFIFWMMSMAPLYYGYHNVLVDFVAYLAVVLAVACACFGLTATFLRFGHAPWSVSDSLAENAYAIYLVHYVFVVWLQYALLGTPLSAIAKALIVFAGTLALSWAVAAGFSQSTARVRRLIPQWRSSSAQKAERTS
jgi:peptidoglycan/LPS O-acetylase OafA/YrhL